MELTNKLIAKGIGALAALTIGGNFLFKKNEEPITQLGISSVHSLLNTAIPKGVDDKSIERFSFKLPEDAKVTKVDNLLTLEQSTTNERVTQPGDNVPEDFNPDEKIITVPQDCEGGKIYTISFKNAGQKQTIDLVIPPYVASKVVEIKPGYTIVGNAKDFNDLNVYIPGSTEEKSPGNIVEVCDMKQTKKK